MNNFWGFFFLLGLNCHECARSRGGPVRKQSHPPFPSSLWSVFNLPWNALLLKHSEHPSASSSWSQQGPSVVDLPWNWRIGTKDIPHRSLCAAPEAFSLSPAEVFVICTGRKGCGEGVSLRFIFLFFFFPKKKGFPCNKSFPREIFPSDLKEETN